MTAQPFDPHANRVAGAELALYSAWRQVPGHARSASVLMNRSTRRFRRAAATAMSLP